MLFSKLNIYTGRINELVELVFANDKTPHNTLSKFLLERLKNEINGCYDFILELINNYHKLNNERNSMNLTINSQISTIKSQKGMLKKQGQEIIKQRKEINRLKKIIEDKEWDKPKQAYRYCIFVTFHNIRTQAFTYIINVVETNNINEFIGRNYFYDVENIKSIHYTRPSASKQECENAFLEDGYEKLDENTFIKRGLKYEIRMQ